MFMRKDLENPGLFCIFTEDKNNKKPKVMLIYMKSTIDLLLNKGRISEMDGVQVEEKFIGETIYFKVINS